MRGELRSISDVGRLVAGGEEKRGRPWLAGLDGCPERERGGRKGRLRGKEREVEGKD